MSKILDLDKSRASLISELGLYSDMIDVKTGKMLSFLIEPKEYRLFCLLAARNGFTWDAQLRRLIYSLNKGMLKDVNGSVLGKNKGLDTLKLKGD